MADAYLKVKDNGAQGLALVREETDTSVSDLKTQLLFATGTEAIEIPAANQGKYLHISNNVIDVNNPATSSSGYGYVIVPCSEGEVFTVSGVSSNNEPMAWAFTKGDYEIITKAKSNITVTDAVITAPENAEWLVIHDKSPYRTSYKGIALYDAVNELNSNKANAYADYSFSHDNRRITQNGRDVSSTGHCTTDKILCNAGKKIEYAGISQFDGGSTIMSLVAFYNSSDECISSITKFGNETGATQGVLTTEAPLNTEYVVASTRMDKISESYLHVFDSDIVKSIKALESNISDLNKTDNRIEDIATNVSLELEKGLYSSDNGEPESSNNWARTKYYVPTFYKIYVPNEYQIGLLAFDNGEYIGVWDGTGFVKNSAPLYGKREMSVADVAAKYPDYKFMLIFSKTNGTAVDIGDLRTNMSIISLPAVFVESVGNMDVPPYYVDHMKLKNASIIENINSVGKNGETFVFITDIHWEVNCKHSPALVKNIIENTNVRLLLCGGDLINTQLKDKAISLIQDCVKSFDFASYPLHMAFGNHDSNALNWNTTEERVENEFDANTVFGATQKNTSFANEYITDTGINFYFDRTDSKTRFIFLDTGTDSTYPVGTIPALCETLNSTPQGYKIVIVQHWLYSGASAAVATLTETAQKLMSIVAQYNSRGSYTESGNTYSFADAAGEIVLMLGGHTHYDIVLEINDADNTAGVPIVCCADDSYRDRNIQRSTVTEQCFDVITLDYINRKIKCVRIGDGSNRTIDF